MDRILDPAILFFLLGLIATFVKSDLEIPQPLPKLFSLYLLFAIGIKGGTHLAHSGLNGEILQVIAVGLLVGALVPVYCYRILRFKLDAANAAAISAAYGSVSAVTFATAQAFAESRGLATSGYMVAVLAVMESPAILVALILAGRHEVSDQKRLNFKKLLHEAFTNGSVFLLLGSLLVGALIPSSAATSLEPFYSGIFKGMLSFFLLDMGMVAARRVKDLAQAGGFLVAFSVLMPALNGLLGLMIAAAMDFSAGNAFLFALLTGSASYIAVPAAMRLALPKANPSYYVSMSLALTFPLNILIGIPFYYELVQIFWRLPS